MAHIVRVHLDKPSTGTFSKSKTARVYLGVAFPDPEFWPAGAVGVPISCTFFNFPSCGRLFGGDEIRAVSDEPISRTPDLVFFWDRAPPGRVVFDVARHETHRLVVGATALQHIEIQWKEMTPAPIVLSTTASEDHLRLLQQPAFLESGDLILCVGDTPTGTSDEARVALQQAAAAGATIEIAVRRGWPEPLNGVEPGCCCGASIKVPKARRRAAKKKPDAAGAVLADLAPRLVEGSVDDVQVDM